MKLWLTKLSVVLITFMTFGVFIPPTYLDAEASEHETIISNTERIFPLEPRPEPIEEIYLDPKDEFVLTLFEKAKEQSFQKLGEKISSQVGDEFSTVILPKIEEVIEQIAKETADEILLRYEITERPSSGYGEKIFHIFDQSTKKDVIRFHVQRVKHPTKGYFFNFHYHLESDQFEHHYQLGEIYWDKNTPPKWMS